MELNEYQKEAIKTAIYPKLHTAPVYPALGLVGEAGEVAEKIKKWVRDDKFDRVAIGLELGDVLWYLALLAYDMGFSLESVAFDNLEKLKSRQRRNKLHGEGDKR